MVFAIDEQTRRLVASVPRGDGVEEFDCVADTCRNPACRCQTVTVAFRARAPGVPAQPVPTPERKVGVDIGTRTIDATFRKSAAQSDIAFAETLLSAMGPADFDLLGRLHFMIKRHETEHAKPAEIRAQFDLDEIERSSMMQTYNDILPFAETMQVVVDGIEYVVLDQYCVKPRCGCTDAHLNLLPIKQEGGTLETTSSVNVNYDAKTWERVADEPLPCDVATFRFLMESTIPDLYTKLQARHKKLCAIYAYSRKRARATIADGLSQQSVGRNDPCPCGSGKKPLRVDNHHPPIEPKMPEHTPKQSGRRAGLPIERIVIDECFRPDSPLLAQLTGRLRSHPVDLVFLAARHPGIPDVEILDKLLDGRTALLTRDRALHNLAIDRGFRSFVQSPDGSLTSRKLHEVATRDKSLPAARGGLRDSYVHERARDAQVIAGSLAGFLSEHQLKQFRTKRRRIRAHFGSADNIAASALTIGQRRTPRGIVGGYVLKVDARHGAKSLSPASEGYFLDPTGGSEPLQALVWALAHVLMLQLEHRPLTLFLCDSDVAETCAALISGRNTERNSVERMAVRLLATAKQPQAQACAKGRFFDRMQAKLDHLSAHDSNELVPIDLQAMADALELSNAVGDDFQ